MTIEEIKKIAQDRIEVLNLSLEETSPLLEYYKEFFEDYPFKNKTDLLNVSRTDLMTAYLLATEKFDDINKLHFDCIKMSQILENVPYETLYDCVLAVDKYLGTVPRETRKSKKMFSKQNKGEADISSIFFDLGTTITNQERVRILAKYANEYEVDMTDALLLATIVNYIEECKERVDNEYPNITERERNNKYMDEITYRLDLKLFNKSIKIIKDYYRKLSNNENDNKKQIQKDIRGYEKILNEIDNVFNQEEIKNYKNFIKNITDESLVLEILKLVYKHNNEYYEKLNKEHKVINEDTKLHYFALLENYGISKDEVDLFSMMEHNLEDLSEMLKELHKISDNKDFIIKGIQESNISRVKDLVSLKDKGFILSQSIYENADLLELDSDKYNKMINSIDYVNEKGLNPGIFINEVELLMDDENIKEKTDLLEKENKLTQLKNTESYEFFNNDHLKEKINLIRRLDLDRFMKDDLDILNEENLERVMILGEIDYEIETKEELIGILRDDKFIVPDNKINDYIFKK